MGTFLGIVGVVGFIYVAYALIQTRKDVNRAKDEEARRLYGIDRGGSPSDRDSQK